MGNHHGGAANPVEVLTEEEEKNSKYHPRPKTLRFKPKFSKLYEYQQTLPSLPVPELDATLNRFLETVRPILNDSEYGATETAVEAFRESSDSKEIQEALIEYAAGETSYMEKFWDDAYLYQEAPIVVNTNPCFILEDDPGKASHDQVARATSICMSTLKLVRLVRRELLEPDMIKHIPLSMDQYETVFGSARIPSADRDEVITDHKSTHIVVLCRGQAFYFDCVAEDGSLAITADEFSNNLHQIIENALKVDAEEVAENAVPVFTTTSRSKWAKIRRKLSEIPANKESLEVIDTALFVLCLDDIETPSITECMRNTLHGTTSLTSSDDFETGTCISRWYDKMQLVVSANGVAGVVWEHSKWDGHTVLRLFSDVMTDSFVKFAQSISGKSKVKTHVQSIRVDPEDLESLNIHLLPRKLKFDLNKKAKSELKLCTTAISKQIKSLQSLVLEYDAYGSTLIKSNGFSPDAFVQLAMICTFYTVKGFLPNQYEAVMTKAFKNGRTEAGRAATLPALDWCRAFDNPDIGDEEKIELLKVATKAHSAMTRRCSKGEGVDRHLYGLKCLWQKQREDKLPDLFDSPGYKKLGVSTMSTSNCGNPALRCFGFGPVTEAGVGIGYMIREYDINFTITSWEVNLETFREELAGYLNQVLYLMKKYHELQKVNGEDNSDSLPSKPKKRELLGETLR